MDQDSLHYFSYLNNFPSLSHLSFSWVPKSFYSRNFQDCAVYETASAVLYTTTKWNFDCSQMTFRHGGTCAFDLNVSLLAARNLIFVFWIVFQQSLHEMFFVWVESWDELLYVKLLLRWKWFGNNICQLICIWIMSNISEPFGDRLSLTWFLCQTTNMQNSILQWCHSVHYSMWD